MYVNECIHTDTAGPVDDGSNGCKSSCTSSERVVSAELRAHCCGNERVRTVHQRTR